MAIDIFSVVVSAVIVVIGWVAAHELNLRRDTLAKRRDLRVQYLIEAYRRLEDSTGRFNALPEAMQAFESAVSDIQLLGTVEQIDALIDFLHQFKDNTSGNVDPVLKLLRDDLRKELNLEPNVKQIHQFRFRKKQEKVSV